MKANTSKEKSFYTQGKQCAARVLLTVWLLVSYSPGNLLAAPDPVPQQAMMLEANNRVLSLPLRDILLSSDPAKENTPQQHISQKVVLNQGAKLLSTFPEASPVEENFSFQARGGENVRFYYQRGRWQAQVSSHIGACSRQSVLPVVCHQGEAVASNLEFLSKYPSWYSQRHIHVLDRKVCPTLGEVVFVGGLGLRGGGEGEVSGSGSTAEQSQQARQQPAATDQASQWKVVIDQGDPANGKLALQEVDGSALWVPKGEDHSSSQLPRESWQTFEGFLQHYSEGLPDSSQETFINTIAPLLKQQWPAIAPELQQTIIHYLKHGGILDPQVLQEYPVSEWVVQSIMHELAQEALSTNNLNLRNRFRSAMRPLQQSQSTFVCTQLLLALQKKQQQCSLELSALCQILEYLPPHTDEAYALVQQPNDTWISRIKAAWLQPRLISLSKKWDNDQCQTIQEYLTNMPWSAALTNSILDALKEQEQDYLATKRFLHFLSQNPLKEETLMQILRRGPPQDRSNLCQTWHCEAACSILTKTLKKHFPTHAAILKTRTATLLQQHLSTYNAFKRLFRRLQKATNSTQRKTQGQQLAIVLELLVDYQAASDIAEEALATLAESPVNEWVQTVYQRLVEATFQDSFDCRPATIAASIAQSAPQAHFAGDKDRLLQSYQDLINTYQGTSSILSPSHKTPIANWKQAQVTQWAKQVKADPKQVSQSEMLAVIQRAVALQHGFLPRPTQLMALLVLLNPAQGTGRLAQINTGEGKSLIVAMLAAFHALQGQHVDVITTSSELAIPEVRKQEPFFNMLHLTVGENSLPGRSDAARAAVYQQDIVYGTAGNFQADILLAEFLRKLIRKRGFGVVIVDEVDSLLFDHRSYNTRLSSPTPGMDELVPVLAIIGDRVNAINNLFHTIDGITYWVPPDNSAPNVADNKVRVDDKEAFIKKKVQPFLKGLLRKLDDVESKEFKKYEEYQIDIEKLEHAMSQAPNADEYLRLKKQRDSAYAALSKSRWMVSSQKKTYLRLPQHLQEFARSQISHWIDSAILALFHYKKDQHYVVVKGKIVPIDHAHTGELQHRTTVEGISPFLAIKEGVPPQLECATNSISQVGYFRRYQGRIYGVTGTLGSQKNREFLSDVYKTDMAVVPPYKECTIVGNTRSAYRCKELLTRILPTEQSWYEAIRDSVLRQARNGQAVLVICKYIDQVEYLKERLQSVYDQRKIFTYNGKCSFSKNEVAAGEIIIATNIAGRGTDLITEPEVEAHGGLHVCITFLPTNSRVELQNAGRTARQGKKGTAQLILRHPDKVTIEALRTQRDQQEADTLAKAQSEVDDMLFEDKIFKQYCELEADLIPTAQVLRDLNLLENLRTQWEACFKDALASKAVQEFYDSYIQSEAEKQLAETKGAETDSAAGPSSAPLSAVTTAPGASFDQKLPQVKNALIKAIPEEVFREWYENFLKERFINHYNAQEEIPADVRSAFLGNQPLESANTPQAERAKKYGWTEHERRGLQETWGLWRQRHSHCKGAALQTAFNSFAAEIREAAAHGDLIQNPYHLIRKGNEKLSKGDCYVDAAIKAYETAIEKDPNNLNAHYLLPRALLIEENNKNKEDKHDKASNVQKALKALETARHLVQHHGQLTLDLDDLIEQAGYKKPRHEKNKIAKHLQHKLDIRLHQASFIQAALAALEIAEKQKWSVKITENRTLEEVFKDAEGDRTQAIAEAQLGGLHSFYIVEERQPFPCRAIVILVGTGGAQIAVAFCCVNPLVASVLMEEGIRDLCSAGKAAYIAKFSWKNWCTDKVMRVSVTMGSAFMGCKSMNTTMGQIVPKLVRGTFHEYACYGIDWGVGKALVPVIVQPFAKQITQKVTQALEKNDLIKDFLDLDIQNQNNDWETLFTYEIKELNLDFQMPDFINTNLESCIAQLSSWLTPAQINELGSGFIAICKGIASNKSQGMQYTLLIYGMACAGSKIFYVTDRFLEKFADQITKKYRAELQGAQQHAKTSQQQRTSVPLVGSDLRTYCPSSTNQLARVLIGHLVSQRTHIIKNSLIMPLGSLAISFMLPEVEKWLNDQLKGTQSRPAANAPKNDPTTPAGPSQTSTKEEAGKSPMADEQEPQSQPTTNAPQNDPTTPAGPSQTSMQEEVSIAQIRATAHLRQETASRIATLNPKDLQKFITNLAALHLGVSVDLDLDVERGGLCSEVLLHPASKYVEDSFEFLEKINQLLNDSKNHF